MKTRLILAGFCLLMLSLFVLGFYLNAVSQKEFMVVAYVVSFIVSPFLFLSSLIMLAFSFFRVQVLPDGRLFYDSRTPFW